MKWMAEITNVGTEAEEIYKEKKQFVFCQRKRASGIEDFVVQHDGRTPDEDLKEGDEVRFDRKVFYILALGNQVNRSIREQGTCTMDFSGDLVARDACTIMLDGEETDSFFVKKGSTFKVK